MKKILQLAIVLLIFIISACTTTKSEISESINSEPINEEVSQDEAENNQPVVTSPEVIEKFMQRVIIPISEEIGANVALYSDDYSVILYPELIYSWLDENDSDRDSKGRFCWFINQTPTQLVLFFVPMENPENEEIEEFLNSNVPERSNFIFELIEFDEPEGVFVFNYIKPIESQGEQIIFKPRVLMMHLF